MVVKTLASSSDFMCVNPFVMTYKSSLRHGSLVGATATKRVREIAHAAFVDLLPVITIALIVVHWRDRAIDWYFMKIGSAKTNKVCIGVRKQSSLQQRVVREIDSRYYMSRVERDLFCFGKKVICIFVQDHFSDDLHRNQFLRNQLGRIEQVKIKFMFVGFRNYL